MNRSLIALLVGLSLVACKKEAKDADTETKVEKNEDETPKKKKKKSADDDEEPKKDDDEKPASGTPKACAKLVSKKDLEDILGHDVKFKPESEGNTCGFEPPDMAKGGFFGSITTHDYNATAWDILNKKSETIEDLGDKAAWGMGLMVKKGDKNLQIVVMKLSAKKDESKNKAIEIAKKVLPKL